MGNKEKSGRRAKKRRYVNQQKYMVAINKKRRLEKNCPDGSDVDGPLQSNFVVHESTKEYCTLSNVELENSTCDENQQSPLSYKIDDNNAEMLKCSNVTTTDEIQNLNCNDEDLPYLVKNQIEQENFDPFTGRRILDVNYFLKQLSIISAHNALFDCKLDIVQEGVRCDECKVSIVGFRYTCLECIHNICGSCEARGAHPLHYVLRVPGQRPHGELEEILRNISDRLQSQIQSQEPTETPRVHTEIKHEAPDPQEFETEETYDGRWPHPDNEMEHTLLNLKADPDLIEEPTPGPQELKTEPQTVEIEHQQHQLHPVSQQLEQGQQQTELVITQELEPLQQQLKPTQQAMNESEAQFKDMEFAVSPHLSQEVNSAQELKPVPPRLYLTVVPLKRAASRSPEPHKILHSSTETSMLQSAYKKKNYVNTKKKKS